MHKGKRTIISFLLPIFLFMMGYFALACTLNGENILVSDMKGQYISLFSYLQNVLKGIESLFYSFSKALGGGMIGTIAYYLASPLNLIIIFFSKADLPIVLLILICLKIGLAGLTMYRYLESHYEGKKMNLIFSTLYALMGYVINYYFHIMWLDAVYLLPLILLGIDRLIQKNKKGLYVFSLALAIFSNFYTGYMICLFAVIYFFTHLFIEKRKIWSKATAHFIICSLLSTGLCAILLLPTLAEIPSYFRYSVDNFWNVNTIWSNFLGILSKLYIGAQNCKNAINPNGTNLYLGTIVYILIYLYFKNPNIEVREKRWIMGLLIFFIVTFTFPIFIYIWHGFSLPNYFQNRNAFVVSFLMIGVAARSYYRLDSFQIKKMIPFFIGFILMSTLLLGQKIDYLHVEEVMITGIALLLNSLLLSLIFQKKRKYVLVLVGMILLEILFNFHFTFMKADNSQYYKNMMENCSEISQSGRSEHIKQYSGLDSFLCETSSLTSFVSTNTTSAYHFFKKMGYSTSGVTQVNNQSNTIVIDSLLNFKNYYNSNVPFYYKKIETGKNRKEDFNHYQNPYALELGYVIDDIPQLTEFPFENQNLLMRSFSGIARDPLEKVWEINESKRKYVFKNIPNEQLYVQIHYNQNDTLRREVAHVKVNGNKLEEWVEHGIFQASPLTDQLVIEVDPIRPTQVHGISIYQLNLEVFEQQIDQLKQNQIQLYQKNKNKIVGKINSLEASHVLLTIPYDLGWTLSIDGKKQEYQKALDYFITFDISQGEHIIELIYIPQLWKEGLIVSFVSFICILLYFRMCKK